MRQLAPPPQQRHETLAEAHLRADSMALADLDSEFVESSLCRKRNRCYSVRLTAPEANRRRTLVADLLTLLHSLPEPHDRIRYSWLA